MQPSLINLPYRYESGEGRYNAAGNRRVHFTFPRGSPDSHCYLSATVLFPGLRNTLLQGRKGSMSPKLGEETVNGVKLRLAEFFPDSSGRQLIFDFLLVTASPDFRPLRMVEEQLDFIQQVMDGAQMTVGLRRVTPLQPSKRRRSIHPRSNTAGPRSQIGLLRLAAAVSHPKANLRWIDGPQEK